MSLDSILACLCGGLQPHQINPVAPQHGRGSYTLIVEKPTLCPPAYTDKPNMTLTSQQQAERKQAGIDIVNLLYVTDKTGAALKAELEAAAPVSTASWSEWLAKSIFHALRSRLGNNGRDTTNRAVAFMDACKVARLTAEDQFRKLLDDAREHPEEFALKVAVEIILSLIAFGILMRTMRWVIVLLGFGEKGVVAGSFAARWEARYEGYIPKGSWFSYLQRVSMT